MKAWQLLEKPEAWTKGANARNKDGTYAFSTSEEAVCWCVRGALIKCYLPEKSFEKECKITSKLGGLGIAFWNDHPSTTHSQVIELLKACDV